MSDQLPSGWVKTSLNELGKWGTGGTPSRKVERYFEGTIPWVKTGELTHKFLLDTVEKISDEATRNSNAKVYPCGSVILAMYGATIGKVSILAIPAATNQACAVLIPNPDVTCSEFVYYLLLNEKTNLINLAKGGAQPNISQGLIRDLVIPLPPLEEQKRIVAKLDRLLARVERCRTRLDRATKAIKNFRQAVYNSASTGNLTSFYRSENNSVRPAEKVIFELKEARNNFFRKESIKSKQVNQKLKKIHCFNEKEINFFEDIPKNWVATYLGNIIYDFSYGTSEKSDAEYCGIPVIRIPNIDGLSLNLSKLKFLKSMEVENNVKIQENDLLIIRSNGSKDLVGKCCVVPKLERDFAFASYLIKMRPVMVESNFIYIVLNSTYVKKQLFAQAKSSAGVNNINTEQLRNITLLLPPLDEQKLIVQNVENLLKVANDFEEKIKTAGECVDKLTASILAKAFRGELVKQEG